MATDLVKAIQDLCDRADEAVEGVKEAIAATRADIATGTCKDPAKAAQNLAIAAGIMIDKAQKIAFDGMGNPEPDITVDPKKLAADLARRLGITDEEMRRHKELKSQMEAERQAGIDRAYAQLTAGNGSAEPR